MSSHSRTGAALEGGGAGVRPGQGGRPVEAAQPARGLVHEGGGGGRVGNVGRAAPQGGSRAEVRSQRVPGRRERKGTATRAPRSRSAATTARPSDPEPPATT